MASANIVIYIVVGNTTIYIGFILLLGILGAFFGWGTLMLGKNVFFFYDYKTVSVLINNHHSS